MYSRSYFPEDGKKPAPPENYSGVALTDEPMSDTADECFEASSDELYKDDTCMKEVRRGADGFFSKFLPSDSPVFRLFGGGGIKSLIKDIGTEEILILATALFLLFSKEGDKECAIILLILLVL